MLEVFETAVRYRCTTCSRCSGSRGCAIRRQPRQRTSRAGLSCWGSLYAMAFTGVRGLGVITPLGGVSFIVGWLALALAALQWRPGLH